MAQGKHSKNRMNSQSRGVIIAVIAIILAVLIIAGAFLVQCTGQQTARQSSSSRTESVSSKAASGSSFGLTSSASSKGEMTPAMATAKTNVKGIVAQYGYSVAVAVVPLDGTQGFSINGDERFVAASMIKLLILAEYAAQVEAGNLDPNATRTISEDEIVGGTGEIQNRGAGAYTYGDLALFMIMYSDNTATNALIDTLGADNINLKASELKLGNTHLNRKMMDLDSNVENYTSANDVATILVQIANDTLATPSICDTLEGYLLRQTDSLGLTQGLPAGIKFAHKTGSLDPIRHDGGIVFADKPYVIVVLTSLGTTGANALMTNVSDAVYRALE